jgi:hypothetical protein
MIPWLLQAFITHWCTHAEMGRRVLYLGRRRNAYIGGALCTGEIRSTRTFLPA